MILKRKTLSMWFLSILIGFVLSWFFYFLWNFTVVENPLTDTFGLIVISANTGILYSLLLSRSIEYITSSDYLDSEERKIKTLFFLLITISMTVNYFYDKSWLFNVYSITSIFGIIIFELNKET
jgi:hypothetical protein